RGQDQAGEGAERVSRSTARAPRRGAREAGHGEGDSPRRLEEGPGRRRADDGPRAGRREIEVRVVEQEFESILEAFPVRLVNFEGPLDLLLHLIKRHELSIYDIPITLITTQYIEYIDLMQ